MPSKFLKYFTYNLPKMKHLGRMHTKYNNLHTQYCETEVDISLI